MKYAVIAASLALLNHAGSILGGTIKLENKQAQEVILLYDIMYNNGLREMISAPVNKITSYHKEHPETTISNIAIYVGPRENRKMIYTRNPYKQYGKIKIMIVKNDAIIKDLTPKIE